MDEGIRRAKIAQATEQTFEAAKNLGEKLGMEAEVESLVNYGSRPYANQMPEIRELCLHEAIAEFLVAMDNKLRDIEFVDESVEPLSDEDEARVSGKNKNDTHVSNVSTDTGETAENASGDSDSPASDDDGNDGSDHSEHDDTGDDAKGKTPAKRK